MKVAIIGAGLAGLACAIEFEKHGIIADIYERNSSVGWIWPSLVYCPSIFTRKLGDVPTYFKKTYDLAIIPHRECKSILMKSANQDVLVDGKLGYCFLRGKDSRSIENQLLYLLQKTPIHYNTPANCIELSKIYDHVVVATGRAKDAIELGLWENQGTAIVVGGVGIGQFDTTFSAAYFNIDYAGAGYGRLTPFSSTHAILGLYIIGKEEVDIVKSFNQFLKYEGLDYLEFTYLVVPPPFDTGRVTKFQVGNILLAGRSAGLTERLLGVGCCEALESGIQAARSIIYNKNYDALVRPLQRHIENISSFRNVVEKYTNEDYDRLLNVLKTSGVKQAIYNTKLNHTDFAGGILKNLYKLFK
ncbi:MAG: NAD(P)-binding protein [Bacillota bacterium]